ncbi:MAG: CPBP family intramembrane metalloprotease [Bacteroidales bacterium]|nr:CPBP family intramembrane metalloprotease [Bacteroidales bacterium]
MKNKERHSYPSIKQSWGILGILIFSIFFFFPVTFLLDGIVSQELSFLVYYFLAFGVPLLIVHLIRKRKTGNAGYRFRLKPFKIIGLTIIAIVALDLGLVLPIISLIPTSDFWDKVFLEFVNEENLLLSSIMFVIAAPILEEFIFRGIILDGLLKSYSPLKSILFSSLLFGIVHLNPWQFVSAFLFGIMAGWVYYKTANLALPILMHFAVNLFSVLSVQFSNDPIFQTHTIIEFYGGIFNFIMITLSALIIASISIIMLNKDFSKKTIEWRTPNTV